MRFLFASDSFKGSLSSGDIIGLLEEKMKQVFPDAICKGVVVADGGEGTVDAILSATGGEREYLDVKNPLLDTVRAYYGKVGDKAIIEMALASGLPLLKPDERNPLYTSTYGTGELIKSALNNGYRDITIAIGGSATNDGGMGAMIALGVRFLDKDGKELAGIGENLAKLASIDISGLHEAVKDTRFTVMCDVNNPLTGERGATYTFAAQKGAGDKELVILEEGMLHYADIIKRDLGVDINDVAGAGAAGGLGAALMVFLKAKLQAGIERVLDLIEFDTLLEDTDICITGEGRVDWQSAHGKVPSGIGNRCKKKNIPAFVIAGGMGKGASDIYEHGIESIITTVNAPMSVEEAIADARELYADSAERAFRLIKLGMNLKERI